VVQKAKAFKPAAERDRVADLIEAEEQEDLEQLEDDFADDSFLEQYRSTLPPLRQCCGIPCRSWAGV